MFIYTVKIMTNLWLMVLIISCVSWVLDFGNVHVLCNIYGKLNDSAVGPKMMKSYIRLKDGEPKINLSSSNHMNTPLSIMIPEHLVPVVKWLRSQKDRWFGKRPISSKWPMYAIKMKLFCFREIWSKIPRMNSCLYLHKLGKSSGCWLRLVLIGITKLLIYSNHHWGSLPAYTCIQCCSRVIYHSSNECQV